MVHWAFLILAFIVGFASCYGLLWYLATVYGGVIDAIHDGVKSASFRDEVFESNSGAEQITKMERFL